MKKNTLGGLLLSALLLLCGCDRTAEDEGNRPQPTPPVLHTQEPAPRPTPTASPETPEGPVPGEELLCLTESEEEAKAIAEQYGIELVRFEYGVATFHTERDPAELIAEGREQGWAELSVNGYKQLH